MIFFCLEIDFVKISNFSLNLNYILFNMIKFNIECVYELYY